MRTEILEYGYPVEYQGPKPIEEQIKTLAVVLDLDPSSALSYVDQLPVVPGGAEGWFAIPSDEGLKKLFPTVDDDTKRYHSGLELVLAKIASMRPFTDLKKDELGLGRLRPHALTQQALKAIAKTQPGDILIVGAQLGLRHRGCSISQARERFGHKEFGLGALAVGSMLLTHPDRLTINGKLEMNCPGDEFNDGPGVNDFHYAPTFDFDYQTGADFDVDHIEVSYGFSGPVSGFIP